MRIKEENVPIISIPTAEYKHLIQENARLEHELKLLRALMTYATNKNKED